MDRSHSNDRRYRRILGVSLVLSVGVHALLFGLRFEAPMLMKADRTIEFETAAITEVPVPFDGAELIALETAATSSAANGPVSDAAPAAEAMSAAASTPAGSASDVAMPVPQAVLADAAFEELTVFDPMSAVVVDPVAFQDLPSAAVDAAATIAMEGEADDDVEVYVPGSIGKAKRAWSGDIGTNTIGNGDGPRIIFGGGGGAGGHCPMPGRGGSVPPIWK